MSKILGYIAYEGPSAIDGAPIVVIINKIDTDSKNDKTGAIVQSFIIRSHVNPVRAPATMWAQITRYALGRRGYTHQWDTPGFDVDAWAPLVMASADTIDQAAKANLLGMRVFRVSIGVDVQPGEASCPASAEAGRKSTCAKCTLCAGTSIKARDIVIADHAAGHARRVIMLAVV